MTTIAPPVAITDDPDDPFLDELRAWFDHLFTVAITSDASWPIVAGLMRDLNRRAHTTDDMDTALYTLIDTAGELVRLNHPGDGVFALRLNGDTADMHPGWIHAARTVAAAAAGDDIEPFLTVDTDTQFGLRVLAGTIGITITQAHQWFTRDQEQR